MEDVDTYVCLYVMEAGNENETGLVQTKQSLELQHKKRQQIVKFSMYVMFSISFSYVSQSLE